MFPASPAAPPPILLLVAALAAAAACGEPTRRPPAPESDASGAGDTAAVAAARYLTEYAFVGGGPEDRRALLLRAVNETSSAGLARDYRATLFGPSGATKLLGLSDTLPVPRAAWRVLPAPGLTLRVADGGELATLRLSGPNGEVRLSRGEPLGEWTGTTGQREVLARATLSGAGGAHAGVLLVRRAARGLDAPPPRDAERLILVADSSGDALLVVQSTAADDTAAAWAWLPETRGSWTGVGLVPADTAGAPAATGPGGTGGGELGDAHPAGAGAVPAGGWRLEMQEAGLRGRILAADGAVAGAPLGRVRAELRAGPGTAWRLHGLTWLSRLP